MSKHVWEGVHDPEKPYVPINEAPDHKAALDPEERVILLDLYQKGLLGKEEREAAEELLGIVTDESADGSGKLEDYYEDPYGKDENDSVKVRPKEPATDERPDHEIRALEEYEKKLDRKDRKAFENVQVSLSQIRMGGRGKKKGNWKSVPGSNRSTIRKPSPDGDVSLKDWA